MFGAPDGSFGAGSGDSLTTAVGVAGGTAAQGLNRALSDVTDLDVSARVDTSTGAPRPELVVQLTPRVAARVTQALGEPTPGQSPDRTFLTIELRLASAWALSAMVGDRGASALDLIWRRRLVPRTRSSLRLRRSSLRSDRGPSWTPCSQLHSVHFGSCRVRPGPQQVRAPSEPSNPTLCARSFLYISPSRARAWGASKSSSGPIGTMPVGLMVGGSRNSDA